MKRLAGDAARTRLYRRALVAPALGCLLVVAGCISREGIHREVAASRAAAYAAWQRRQANEKETEPLLKGDLTLEDALKLAMVYNKPLRAAIQEKEIGRGRIVESYSEALPKISAVGTYTRLDKVSSLDVGGRSISLGFINNYSVGLEVRQPLFRGGAISAAMRAARVFAALGDEVVRGQVQQTIYQVAQAYFDALLAQHLYTVFEDAVRSAEVHLKDVQRKREGGVASEFDILRARVDVSNFRAEMIQQRNRVHLAKTRLFKAVGVSQQSNVELRDKLTHEAVTPDRQEAVRLAYMNRPDLYQAELAVRLQQEALRIARSRYWPNVDLSFTQQWARPDPHFTTADHWGDQWVAGAVLDWPLFDGLSREGRIIQERAALEQRQIELVDAQEQALLEIQQAILSLRDAEEFVQSQRLNLERAAEGLRLSEVGYREGINTEVEVTDARAALTRARGLYYQAVYDHTMVRLELQRAMGVLGPKAGDYGVPTESPARPARVEQFAVPAAPLPGGDNPNAGKQAADAGPKPEGEKMP